MIRIECPSGHSKDAKITDLATGEDLTPRYCITGLELTTQADGKDGWTRATVTVKREPIALDVVATADRVLDPIGDEIAWLRERRPGVAAEVRERLARIADLLERAYPKPS